MNTVPQLDTNKRNQGLDCLCAPRPVRSVCGCPCRQRMSRTPPASSQLLALFITALLHAPRVPPTGMHRPLPARPCLMCCPPASCPLLHAVRLQHAAARQPRFARCVQRGQAGGHHLLFRPVLRPGKPGGHYLRVAAPAQHMPPLRPALTQQHSKDALSQPVKLHAAARQVSSWPKAWKGAL